MYREFLADCKPCPNTINARTAKSLLLISNGNSFFRPEIIVYFLINSLLYN